MGIAAVGLVLAAVGTGISLKAASDQRKAAKKQQRAQAGQAAIENRRRRAELIRQQQLAQARAESVQATQGGGEVSTSMATGALFTSGTQGAVNLANFQEFGRLNTQIASAQSAYSKASSLASMGSGLQTIGGFVYGNAGRLSSLGGGRATPAPVTDLSQPVGR